MTTTPLALAQIVVSGGGPQQGGITVAGGDTIQLSGTNTSGWTSVRWEIFASPPGWATPTGWTLDTATGIVYSTDTTPTLITLPAASALWGKWLVRLIVNGGTKNGVPPTFDPVTGSYLPNDVVDIASGWQVLSPGLALTDLGLYEGTQFGGLRRWAAAIQQSLRAIDAVSASGSTSWDRITGGSAAVSISATALPIGVSVHALSAPAAVTLPATPNSYGQDVYAVDEDGTGMSEGVVLDGNGHNIVDQGGTSASTYTFSTAAHGYAAYSTLHLAWIPGANFWKVM